jgi:outer membrane lipoprotein SlyB
MLKLALTSVEIDGKDYDLQTTSVTRSGRNHNKRNAVLIGGGTGVGAAIGAAAGGGKGALIGGAIGAGAGTGTAAATGKLDITIPAESQLSFKLTQPVTVQVKG